MYHTLDLPPAQEQSPGFLPFLVGDPYNFHFHFPLLGGELGRKLVYLPSELGGS